MRHRRKRFAPRPKRIGKSYLCGCFTEKLPEKRYKILSLAHSSLTGSDLIRALCRQLGASNPKMRRSDNVANIHSALHSALGQLGSRWPLPVLKEAKISLADLADLASHVPAEQTSSCRQTCYTEGECLA